MVNDWLKKQKVIVCAGTGGVGKTTIAAALGVRAQQLGLRTLVLTIDPARRLADALGLSQDMDDPVLVSRHMSGVALYACMLNPERVFDQFVKKNALRSESVVRLMNSRLYMQLKSSLSGSQEFTALERLRSFVDSHEYQLVILDTPPAQHAMDFLSAPMKLNALFQSSIIQWFAQGASGQGGFFRKLFQRSTIVVMKSLEKLTGASFVKELSEFFSSVGDWHELLQNRTQRAHELLLSESTQFVLVTSFDRAKILESLDFAKELENRGYHLGLAVINRSFPEWLDESEESGKELPPELGQYYRKLKTYYGENEKAYSELVQKMNQDTIILRILDFDQDINSLSDLENLVKSIPDFN
jgi:anion-transporting  ArsA/GET3 family ATPase